ncbi:DUF1127 domain-containing protein [Methylobacterium sp. J-070]|nr:DUF1127 domain-containing protein [Methylobacterium sp. J-070]
MMDTSARYTFSRLRLITNNPRRYTRTDQPQYSRSSLSGWIGRLQDFIVQEIKIRRAHRELGAMNDAMLADIGIRRAQIPGAVRFGRARASDWES